MADAHQLPACRRCRTRKQRCDKAVPRCSGCARANVDCLFLDATTGDEYSRQSVADLETLEADLRFAVEDHPSSQHRTASPRPGHEAPPTANEPYIGDGSGINVIETIFSNPRFQPQLLKHLLARPRIQQPQVPPAALPSVDIANFLFTTYLRESHVQKPFLMEADVASLLERIYSPAGDQTSSEDLFDFYMICAISAVPLRRRGYIQEHPYSFFLSARSHADRVNMLSGIQALQHLMLLARFGVYFHTGASTWEVGRICMAICTSMEFHLNPLRPMPAIEEQRRRRVFWEAYVLDRHTSMILGRPFALADEDIEVDLPVDFPDTELVGMGPGSLAGVYERGSCVSSPMAVSICFLRLRRITSRIHTTFFTNAAPRHTGKRLPEQFEELGRTYGRFQELLDELEEWHKTTPSFAQPESLYHRPQWFEFLCEKERLFLIRAMINAASINNGDPSRDLCRMCCDCATRVISLYAEMYWAKQINCTRHYFQILLTAGLLLANFSSGGISAPRHLPTSDRETLQSLASCSKILLVLATEMSDARPYSTVFDLFCETAFPGFKAQVDAVFASNTMQEVADTQAPPSNTLVSGFEDIFNLDAEHFYESNNNGTAPDSNVFSHSESLPSDWSYFPGQMFADVEAYVNQFATGDFSADPFVEPSLWSLQPDLPPDLS